MAVEVCGECELERVVLERQRRHRGLHESRVGQALACHAQHRLALVDADHVSAEQARQPAGAAGDVERTPLGELGEEALEALEVGSRLACAEKLIRGRVVLGRPPLVVLLHPANTLRSASSITSGGEGGR